MCSLVSHTQAETRAEFAERTVAKLEKSIDDLEGTDSHTNTGTFSLFTGTEDYRFLLGWGGGDLRCKNRL